MTNTQKLYRVKELAELLSVSLSTVYRLYSDGELGGYMVGGSLRFSEDQVNEYLNNVKKKKGK